MTEEAWLKCEKEHRNVEKLIIKNFDMFIY